MRFSLLCAGLLLAAGTAQAQVYLSAGPTVGYSYTSFDNGADNIYLHGPTFQQHGLWRPQGGLTFNARLGHFALQPSVLFVQKGNESHYTAEGRYQGQVYYRRFEQSTKINYLEIPLNLVASLGREGRGLQVLAGPYLAVTLSGKEHTRDFPDGPAPTSTNPELNPSATHEATWDYTVGKPENNQGYSPALRRTDWGGNAGLGYALGRWQLQATYSRSLRGKPSPTPNPTYAYLPHRTYQLRLSYLLGGQREHKLPGFLSFLNLKPAQ
ncbi:PorT family protein [Hymenobacter gummosus]|uniref:PorT family protein n=1 Tax=Hymenobacter gummosus TaxID=1776032 RepID=A0A431U1Q2_9BACT|nr:porin family protein [Hymenobacter gummosus]RTQ49153.1 PorT family protein [Hymenobacter gummosus]